MKGKSVMDMNFQKWFSSLQRGETKILVCPPENIGDVGENELLVVLDERSADIATPEIIKTDERLQELKVVQNTLRKNNTGYIPISISMGIKGQIIWTLFPKNTAC